MRISAQKIRRLLVCSTPVLVSVVVLLLTMAVPVGASVSFVVPSVGFVCIYHWSLHEAELFPFSAAFGFGLLVDLLTGAPLGEHALLFVLFRRILPMLYKQQGAFSLHLWWFFALASGVFALLRGLMTFFLTDSFSSAFPLLWNWIATVLIYPLLAALFAAVGRRMAAP